MLPKIAEGDANKLWIVPSEIGDALKGLPAPWATSAPWAEAATASGNGGSSGSERRGEALDRLTGM